MRTMSPIPQVLESTEAWRNESLWTGSALGRRPFAESWRTRWAGCTAIASRLCRRVVALGLFFLIWHLLTAFEVTCYVRFLNIPGPLTVLTELQKLATSAVFYTHILTSLERIYLGFSLAACLGILCGVLIGWYRPVADLLFPIIELLRPIPAVAWVPLAIMLWPTERSSIVYITALGAFFPIVLNTRQGVEGIDQMLIRAATSLGANRWAIFREVVLPGALPSIVTGLSVGMGVSWICLISAEMVAGQYGIGYYTWVAYGVVKYPAIVVGMLTIGVLGMGSSALVYAAGHQLMPWRPHLIKEESR
jgi:NitT/TauT family transport system permease protein